MTRRDLGILGVLVALLGALAIVIAAPSGLVPRQLGPGGFNGTGGTSPPGGSGAPATGIPSGSGQPGSTSGPASLPTIRDGILSRPSSINPLTARTQADRDLVALVFSGLAKLGPNGTVVPDLAGSWTVSNGGARYTVRIRPDARWQDGFPVTARDVVFTVRLLQNPAYTGPGAASWSEVSVRQLDDLTVRFDLRTALGGWVDALRQPLLPEHLLRDVTVDALADSPFSTAPLGSGPYRLVRWDQLSATLEPVTAVGAGGTDAQGPTGSDAPGAGGPPQGTAAPSDPASPAATLAPTASSAAGATGTDVPPRLELWFYSTADALATAFRAGEVDRADGLPAAEARALASATGARLVREPRATLTTILFNERPSHPQFRVEGVRRALVAAIDRNQLVRDVLSGLGVRADAPIPPTSWAFSRTASRPVAYNPTAAAKALRALGWKRVSGAWQAPGASRPFVIEIICPREASNPTAWSAARFVALAWKAFGFKVRLVALDPAALVGDRLSQADFSVAVIDIDLGLDPDLFPLLASRQAGAGGSNIAGVQSLVLDAKLQAARRPATEATRRAAYADLQAFLAKTQVLPTLFFRDALTVVSNRVTGGVPRLLGDPADRFWDVLTWRLAAGG